MKSRILIGAAALTIVSPLFVLTAQADDRSPSTQPGFTPDTGQINPGHAAAPWSAAAPLPQDQQPAQEDARAALMMPDNGAPSAGQSATPPSQSSSGQSNTGQENSGQANSAQTNTAQTNSAQNNSAEANGSQTSAGNAAAAAGAPPAGPIGATIQTMPAKFSKRNDLLDHMPMMAWPLPLNEQQRQQIYQAVMAETSAPAAEATKLKPADALSFQQRRDMHPLPESLAAIDGLKGLQYLKGKDKVLLVRPSTGIVVDEVAM